MADKSLVAFSEAVILSGIIKKKFDFVLQKAAFRPIREMVVHNKWGNYVAR